MGNPRRQLGSSLLPGSPFLVLTFFMCHSAFKVDLGEGTYKLTFLKRNILHCYQGLIVTSRECQVGNHFPQPMSSWKFMMRSPYEVTFCRTPFLFIINQNNSEHRPSQRMVKLKWNQRMSSSFNPVIFTMGATETRSDDLCILVNGPSRSSSLLSGWGSFHCCKYDMQEGTEQKEGLVLEARKWRDKLEEGLMGK